MKIKSNIIRRIIPLLCILLIASGCATIKGMVQKPQVRFAGMGLDNLSLLEATPIFKFKVSNPNAFGVMIKSVAYNLKINQRKFIKGVADKGVQLPAGETDIIEVPITVNYLDLFESITEFKNSARVDYDLSGNIEIGPFTIPYENQGKLTIPRLPRVSLQNVKVADLTLTGADVTFDLEIGNDNPFALNLSGLNYGIRLGGKEFISGETRAIPTVEKNGFSTLSVPMRVNFFKLGRSVYNLLKSSTSDYEIIGEMQVDVPKGGQKRIPFQHSGNVPVK